MCSSFGNIRFPSHPIIRPEEHYQCIYYNKCHCFQTATPQNALYPEKTMNKRHRPTTSPILTTYLFPLLLLFRNSIAYTLVAVAGPASCHPRTPLSEQMWSTVLWTSRRTGFAATPCPYNRLVAHLETKYATMSHRRHGCRECRLYRPQACPGTYSTGRPCP